MWKPEDRIYNKHCRMLNFKQSLYKSLITFANGGDDEAGFCFFYFTPCLAGVKDKAN